MSSAVGISILGFTFRSTFRPTFIVSINTSDIHLFSLDVGLICIKSIYLLTSLSVMFLLLIFRAEIMFSDNCIAETLKNG